jgi:hypothetical protein
MGPVWFADSLPWATLRNTPLLKRHNLADERLRETPSDI